MKAHSTQEAWNIANEIFPTDYEKDEESSQRAGYPIYRSTAEGRYYDYICDLNNRLEVNLADGNRSINIWIESSSDESTSEGVEAMHAAKELGKSISPLFDPEIYTEITLVVDGSKWNPNETEKKVYEGLKRDESWLASDLVASYCDNNGIRWGVIKGLHIQHYEHGKDGENGGHFVVTAYVGKRTDEGKVKA